MYGIGGFVLFVGGCGNLLRGIQPGGQTSKAVSRQDVFGVGITHHKDFVGCCILQVDGCLEDAWVGLAIANDGRLDYMGKVGIEAEVGKHSLEVTIEVADKREGIMLGEGCQDSPRLVHLSTYFLIAVSGNLFCHLLTMRLLDGACWEQFGLSRCGPELGIDQEGSLYVQFDAKQVKEIVLWLDERELGKSAFSVNIGQPVVVITDWDGQPPVASPNHFGPVLSAGIEGPAVVEKDASYHRSLKIEN